MSRGVDLSFYKLHPPSCRIRLSASQCESAFGAVRYSSSVYATFTNMDISTVDGELYARSIYFLLKFMTTHKMVHHATMQCDGFGFTEADVKVITRG